MKLPEDRLYYYAEDGVFHAEIASAGRNNGWLLLGLLLYFGLKLPYKSYKLWHLFERDILHNPHPDPVAVALQATLAVVLAVAIATAVAGTLWSLFGKETVHVEREQLTRQLNLLGFGPRRVYSLHKIANLKASHQPNRLLSILRGGDVTFTYEGKPQRFGWALSRQEAEELTVVLQPHLRENTMQLFS